MAPTSVDHASGVASLSRYIEFPITRAWALAALAAGRRPTLIMSVDLGIDIPVRLIAVPAQGPVMVKLRSGFEVQVPVAALRKRVYSRDDRTPSSTGLTDSWEDTPPEGSR